MTMCPNSKTACECQPQDGVMCPHGPTPPFQPWKPEWETFDYRAVPQHPQTGATYGVMAAETQQEKNDGR